MRLVYNIWRNRGRCADLYSAYMLPWREWPVVYQEGPVDIVGFQKTRGGGRVTKRERSTGVTGGVGRVMGRKAEAGVLWVLFCRARSET